MGGKHRRGGEVVQKLAPHVAELNCIWATSWIFKTTFIIPTNDFPPIKQASREWHLNDIWVLSIYNVQFASNINIWGLFFFFCTRARSMKQRKALPTLPLVSAAVVHFINSPKRDNREAAEGKGTLDVRLVSQQSVVFSWTDPKQTNQSYITLHQNPYL